MSRYVALLRGINVGGRNMIKMAELKACFEQHGFRDVATYIQSGNVIFNSEGSAAKNTSKLATDLERAIAAELGVRPRVVVLTRAELAKVIKANPYPDAPNPKLVHAIFLTGKPTTAQRADIEAAQAKAERLAAGTPCRWSIARCSCTLRTVTGRACSPSCWRVVRPTPRSPGPRGTGPPSPSSANYCTKAVAAPGPFHQRAGG